MKFSAATIRDNIRDDYPRKLSLEPLRKLAETPRGNYPWKLSADASISAETRSAETNLSAETIGENSAIRGNYPWKISSEIIRGNYPRKLSAETKLSAEIFRYARVSACVTESVRG